MNARMKFALAVAGVGYCLAQRRRGAEESLDRIYMIDRIKKGAER